MRDAIWYHHLRGVILPGIALALLLMAAGCPRNTMADLELTERLMILEDGMVQMDQERAELATRLLMVEGQLARQDTLLRRMGRMLDEMAVALERR